MLKIAISGSTGRIGKALIKAIGQNEDFELVGGVAGQENQNIGKDLGEIAEVEKICLLYTSPSPRDLSTSRMPSSA